jgi:hypothetical protein
MVQVAVKAVYVSIVMSDCTTTTNKTSRRDMRLHANLDVRTAHEHSPGSSARMPMLSCVWRTAGDAVDSTEYM